jgi:hypothetical protein
MGTATGGTRIWSEAGRGISIESKEGAELKVMHPFCLGCGDGTPRFCLEPRNLDQIGTDAGSDSDLVVLSMHMYILHTD